MGEVRAGVQGRNVEGGDAAEVMGGVLLIVLLLMACLAPAFYYNPRAVNAWD